MGMRNGSGVVDLGLIQEEKLMNIRMEVSKPILRRASTPKNADKKYNTPPYAKFSSMYQMRRIWYVNIDVMQVNSMHNGTCSRFLHREVRRLE